MFCIGIRHQLCYFFLFNLWKLGLMGWLNNEPWSSLSVDLYGIRGFLTGPHTSAEKLHENVGEAAFLFSCFGTSSLSRILEVFSSNCLLVCDGDATGWSSFGFGMHVGECMVPSSVTISCSHSSARDGPVLFSPTLVSVSGFDGWKSELWLSKSEVEVSSLLLGSIALQFIDSMFEIRLRI